MRLFVCVLMIVCCGVGCADVPPPSEPPVSSSSVQEQEALSPVVYPVEGYIERRTQKQFGQRVQDRFTGYHAGDDIEFTSAADQARDIPVVAIADGEVVRVSYVSGYGGVIVTRHAVNGRIITALYGHIDLSSTTLRAGDLVTRGQFLANLGDHASSETDGERKHLHFALYEGSDGRVNGYEATKAGLERWIDPSAFLAEQ